MLLSEVVEEIIERAPDSYRSIPSILRKITQVRDQIIRNFGPAQRQSEPIVSTVDIIKGKSQYPLPCPPGNVVDVDMYVSGEWRRMAYRQFDERFNGAYYYFLNGTIGLVPEPDEDIEQGLKIFHTSVLAPLTVNDMNGLTGLDPNFDMVLVFGVLKDITTGSERSQYREQYEQWLYDYRTANSGWERHVVKERW
ncbi:phage adaptor protein [Paenibacillus senegalensis]|uniref:phage adaptor protein n=1 Tax=Paenibacillus senegalensis TaxID=1465766 RepID=UPI00028911C6|nr:hypothetical protein [Paenibacillus senegalensis]